MIIVAADLHIHSALSPCAANDLTPPEIVQSARAAGLGLIAVCDHNSAGNAAAVQQAAEGEPVVLAGMEIMTAEEAHVVALFPDAASAMAAAATVLGGLPSAAGAAKQFGEQWLLGARGERIGTESRLLSASSTVGLTAAVALVHRNGGLAVAAHVDRPSFSVISQLGLFPREAGFDAIEISVAGLRAGREGEFADLGLPILVGSDSHNLSEIGACRTELVLRERSFAALAEHLRGPYSERRLYA